MNLHTVGRRNQRCSIPMALVVVILAVTPAGCGGNDHAPSRLVAACRAVGICDQAPPSPIVVDIVCDASRGSSCTAETVRRSLDVVLLHIAQRPGSLVRLWALGTEVSDTALVGEQASTASARRGSKARKVYEERFVATAREYLEKSVEPFLNSPRKNRSPIAEGLSRVAIAGAPPGLGRIVVLISDLREVSGFGDFECGRLPSPSELVSRFQRVQVLARGSLDGVCMFFTFVGVTPVDGNRCAMTLDRARRVEALWRAAAVAAGAAQVRVEDQGVQAAALEGTQPSDKEMESDR